MRFVRSALAAGIPFGLAMTAFFTMQHGLERALVAGPISGVLFGVAIAAFSTVQRRRLEIPGGMLDGERVLHQGPANHVRGIESRGGWLVLTERSLAFRSHGLNVQNAPLRLALADIRAAFGRRTGGLIPNGLRVDRKDGGEEIFVVGGRGEWLRALEAALASRQP